MKLSTIYRRAARLTDIETGRPYAACYAVNEVVTGTYRKDTPEAEQYAELFAPSPGGSPYNDFAWGEVWGNRDEQQACRTLALLFMSAMMKAEGN